MAKKKLTLNEWVEREGAKKIKEALNTEYSNINHWKKCHCLPRPEQMQMIKKLSRGAVTYDSMIEGYLNAKGQG